MAFRIEGWELANCTTLAPQRLAELFTELLSTLGN